ncbi:hypothetical protein [Methanogenium cariaci]
MDGKNKTILEVVFICAVILFFIAFAATTGLSRTTLKDYREDTQDHEKHLTFSHKGEDIVTLSVRATPGAYSDNSTIPLMVELAHPEHTKIDSLKISIHPPGTNSAFSYGDIYLKTPEWNPDPPLSFHTNTESGKSVSVLDIPNMGVQGKGTVRFDFLMRPFQKNTHQDVIHVSIYAKLSGTRDFWNKYVVFRGIGILLPSS